MIDKKDYKVEDKHKEIDKDKNQKIDKKINKLLLN